ncbi:hypothetical protein ACOMHN_067251 [Nucella lapillus]
MLLTGTEVVRPVLAHKRDTLLRELKEHVGKGITPPGALKRLWHSALNEDVDNRSDISPDCRTDGVHSEVCPGDRGRGFSQDRPCRKKNPARGRTTRKTSQTKLNSQGSIIDSIRRAHSAEQGKDTQREKELTTQEDRVLLKKVLGDDTHNPLQGRDSTRHRGPWTVNP